MSVSSHPIRAVAVLAAAASSLVLVAPSAAGAENRHRGEHHGNRLAVSQVNLVSDLATVGASVVDPDLVNPWGLALGPTSPLWSANNGTDTATLYSSAAGSTTAAKVSAVRVTFPDKPELPTGQVFNGTTGFVLTQGTASAPARFLFSTLTGRIEAWAPGVDPAQGNAETKATVPGAAYTGLALAVASSGPQLYAANFAQGTVDVFDSTFTLQSHTGAAFHDRKLPKGYAPFGIATLNGNIFVAYAKVDPVTHRNAVGRGLGFVDEFTPEGRLISRVAARQSLNAPWGLEIAPPSWGELAGDLLVGNFGDGRINVIEHDRHGRFGDEIEGQLRNSSTGKTLVIPGLWALLRGTASTGGADSVWFSAGIDNEQHGLIGVLRKP
ncbi:MAG: hypothetical protein QOD87_2002 [Pseudonocardiales bacterium]|nr:hypothetical protein [Pseudonocardiales bacterium]